MRASRKTIDSDPPGLQILDLLVAVYKMCIFGVFKYLKGVPEVWARNKRLQNDKGQSKRNVQNFSTTV